MLDGSNCDADAGMKGMLDGSSHVLAMTPSRPVSRHRGKPRVLQCSQAARRKRDQRAVKQLSKLALGIRTRDEEAGERGASVRAALDGVLLFSAADMSNNGRKDATFATIHRMALSSLHHGSNAIAQLGFGSRGRRTTVGNARARIARAVQCVGQGRLAAFLAEVARAAPLVAEAAAPSSAVLASTATEANQFEALLDAFCRPTPKPRRLLTAIGRNLGLFPPPPHGQGEFAPLVVLAFPWKFDSTPSTFFVTQLMGTSVGTGDSVFERVRARGASLFHQRGAVSAYVPGRGVQHRLIPFSPVALASGTARTMMKAVRFPYLVEAVATTCQEHQASARDRLSLIVLLPLCVDAASANMLLFNHLLWYYEQSRRKLSSTLVLLAVVQCTSHQVHLCSRSVLALTGGTTPQERKEFVRGLVGAAHTFGQSSYFYRLYVGLAKTLDEVLFVPAGDAADIEATPAERKLKGALLRHVVSWVLGGRELPEQARAAIDFITGYLNGPLEAWGRGCAPFHAHGPSCQCGGPSLGKQRLFSHLGHLLQRVPQVFSETRWTNASPCLAYFALWLLPHSLGKRAMSVAFERDALMRASNQADAHAGIDDEGEWQRRVATRLGRTSDFLHGQGTAFSCLLALLANAPLQQALFTVFGLEAARSGPGAGEHFQEAAQAMGHAAEPPNSFLDPVGRTPDLAAGSVLAPTGCAPNIRGSVPGPVGSDPSSTSTMTDLVQPAAGVRSPANDRLDPTGPLEPPAVVLARGHRVERILVAASRVLAPVDTEADEHVQAFRLMFCNGPDRADRIRTVWASLLAGAAQLWYRLWATWQRFPYKLLLLASATTAASEAMEIARELLAAPACCVDPGLSGPLRDLAVASSASSAGQIDFLLSNRVLAIVRQWATTAPTSIHDIECMNAFVRRLQPGGPGRPKDFASAAAHVFLKECAVQFEASTDSPLPDAFAQARDDVRVLTQASPKSRTAGRAPGAQYGYNEFCKAEHARLKAAANVVCPKPCGCSPQQERINQSWHALPASAKAVWAGKAAAKNQDTPSAGSPRPVRPIGPIVAADADARPKTLTGDTKHILTEAEYNTSQGHSHCGVKGLEAHWRQTHNKPLGAVQGAEQDFTPEAPRCCLLAGNCDRHPMHIREVSLAATSAICRGLCHGAPGILLPSLWQLTWRIRWAEAAGSFPEPAGRVPGSTGIVPPTPGAVPESPGSVPEPDFVRKGEAAGCELFLVAHALLGPYRVIVLPLQKGASANPNYRMSYDRGRWDFALLYDFVAHCLGTCSDSQHSGMEPKVLQGVLDHLTYEPSGWDQLRPGVVERTFDLLAAAPSTASLTRGIRAVNRLLATIRGGRGAKRQGGKRPGGKAPRKGKLPNRAAAKRQGRPRTGSATGPTGSAIVADVPVPPDGLVLPARPASPPQPAPLARPVLPIPAEISEGMSVPARSTEGVGAERLLEDDGQEQWMDGAVVAEAELNQAGQLLHVQAVEQGAFPGLLAAAEVGADPDPAWLPENPRRTDFGLVERVLGADAYAAMTSAGLTMYYEHRRGKHGGYVAKVWLTWPKKSHLFLLPESAVLLAGPGDHARAIHAVYEGAVLAELRAKRFSKPGVASPPGWALMEIGAAAGSSCND